MSLSHSEIFLDVINVSEYFTLGIGRFAGSQLDQVALDSMKLVQNKLSSIRLFYQHLLAAFKTFWSLA